MKIHVKPNKTLVIVNFFAFLLVSAMGIYGLLIVSDKIDTLVIILFFLILDGLLFYFLRCALRSYTFDTDGIYVKWHLGNKTKFYPWSDFKYNYCTRTNMIGEHLEVVVLSRKKHLVRANPRRVVIEGEYPFTTVGVILRDDSFYLSTKHQYCVRKTEFLELLQKCNVSVDWNS